MEHHLLPVESIQERDIDMILLEELTTDITFCEWFTNQLHLPIFTATNTAFKSISEFGLGETDILFSYLSEHKRVYILIENKLDAHFQKEQFIRYQNRAKQYVDQLECEEAYTVLVAPKLYCEKQLDFERYITYEEIAGRLEAIGTKRSLFKSKLIRIGVEKLRRGYQPVNSIPVQRFWIDYWHLKEEILPDFYMKRPQVVPNESDWPILLSSELPTIAFFHKLSQGNIDANLRGMDEQVAYQLEKILPEWITLVRHKRTFSLRIFTGKIDRLSSFEAQMATIKHSFVEIVKLKNWILGNINHL